MSITRRGLFGLFGGCAAAAVIPKVSHAETVQQQTTTEWVWTDNPALAGARPHLYSELLPNKTLKHYPGIDIYERDRLLAALKAHQQGELKRFLELKNRASGLSIGSGVRTYDGNGRIVEAKL